MGQEFELKYRGTEAAFRRILADHSGFSPIEMETTYYDTFDGKLRNLRWMLRRRMENGTSVCTLKTPGQGDRRGEWEVEAGGIMTGVPALCQAGAPMELMALCVSGLTEVGAARFTRQALLLEVPGATLELALDRGVLRGCGRETPLLEIELELKAGSEEAVEAFARDFAHRYGLEAEPRSKFARVMILAAGGTI